MNVPSYAFLGFAAIVAILINISSAAPWRRWVLLVANVAFLLSFTHDPIMLAPFVALLALGFASVKYLEVYKSKIPFYVLVIAVLAAYCLLKRYLFMPPGLFLPFAYFTVGMSYVFFRIMSLVIDAYQESLPDRVDLLSYVNYTLNFTCLVSGPIQMYREYRLTESERPLPLDRSSIVLGLERVIVGFFKVSIVSPLFAYAQERCIAALSPSLSFGDRAIYAALIVSLYPLYLYYNFSGYTDFVIGVARFLRLELPENFNVPFSSKGFIEFWSRWHMTLSNWLKTYVYSPLLLALLRKFPSQRIEPALGVFAYFVTFFLVGLWHGQTSMFIVFGILQGLGVSLNKIYQLVMTRRMGRAGYRALCANPLYSSLSRGLTFGWFAFSLLWFWSSWAQLGSFVYAIGPAGIAIALLFTVVVAAILLSWLELAEAWPAIARTASSPFVKVAWYTVLVVVIVSVTVVLNAPAPHIIYRAF